jgi:hypothetical protein
LGDIRQRAYEHADAAASCYPGTNVATSDADYHSGADAAASYGHAHDRAGDNDVPCPHHQRVARICIIDAYASAVQGGVASLIRKYLTPRLTRMGQPSMARAAPLSKNHRLRRHILYAMIAVDERLAAHCGQASKHVADRNAAGFHPSWCVSGSTTADDTKA